MAKRIKDESELSPRQAKALRHLFGLGSQESDEVVIKDAPTNAGWFGGQEVLRRLFGLENDLEK